jgi:four helix bundle protein
MPQDLRKRTKAFALRIIRLYASLPKTTVAQVLGKQILRSVTSVGAQYHEACRAKSNADFVSKIEGASEETRYWLELLIEAEIVAESKLKDLCTENTELIAMFVSMAKGVKGRQRKTELSSLIPPPSSLSYG